MNRGARWLVAASLVLAGCGGGDAVRPHAVSAPPVVHPSLVRRPLEEYVPAAGLRWLLLVQLREIAETPWLHRALTPLFPDERLDAYAAATGLDLRRCEQGLIAGFDYGTLYLARTAAANARVEELFLNRLPAGPVEQHSHPDLRVLTGMIRETPTALVSQRGYLVGVAVGDPTLARVVEAYARDRLESVTALRGAALATLPPSTPLAPVRFYAPGPFEGEWRAGAYGILAAATAVRVTVRPLRSDQIRVAVDVAGDWSMDKERVRSSAAQVFEDLSGSPLGKLLALDTAPAAPIITAGSDSIHWSVDLAVGPLVAGLHAAVAADVWELMKLPSGPESAGDDESSGQ